MASVNLTPESAQFLWEYDDKRKWSLICEHDGMIVKKSPQEYVSKLKVTAKFSPKTGVQIETLCSMQVESMRIGSLENRYEIEKKRTYEKLLLGRD